MGESQDEVVVSWLEIERKVDVVRVESPPIGASYYAKEAKALTLWRSDQRSQRAF